MLEWIGLVGTVIGAGVGAASVVGSMVIRARQEASAEERQHQRDQKSKGRERQWEITLAGLDARRAAYVSLMEIITEYEQKIGLFVERTGMTETPSDSERTALLSDLDRLSAMVPSIEMHAQSEAVSFLLRSLVLQGRSLLATLNEDPSGEHFNQIELSKVDVQRLRNACRWDLGLNGTDPRTFLQLEPTDSDC
ncbi:hypothetical protein [Actinocorallia aurantiaca]|uniref:Uncharacterized protein n=1 Tax=Actinocorallia aurantiaca TaxID=46204 RepID=A0ABP6GTI6_9ACTN